jgi:hypothetical protein
MVFEHFFWTSTSSWSRYLACVWSDPKLGNSTTHSNSNLGSLRTRAKSHDHEIVRAQKKLSKGRPNTPPKSCSVVTHPQVQCEVICDRALNQMPFQWIPIHTCPHTYKAWINQWLRALGMPWSPGFVLGLPPRSDFWKQSKWPWTMIHSISWRNPCRLLHPSCTHLLHRSRKHSVK